MSEPESTAPPPSPTELSLHLRARDPYEAARLLDSWPDHKVVQVLSELPTEQLRAIFGHIPWRRRASLIQALPGELTDPEWLNESYPESTVGRLMNPALATFSPELMVADVITRLRELLTQGFFSYAYVVDARGRLLGVLVMRDLLLAERDAQLADVMIPDPFTLKPDMAVIDAMKVVLDRHYPDYPVCTADGALIGVVRGETLFQAQTIEISAQAGSMVGVDKEERLATPWKESLKLRHPWLQLNLFTAFGAGAVVSVFQGTIDQVVVLAAFLPVLAGQSGNTGCQALAVTLRGMTLGDLNKRDGRRLIAKEAILGLCNGILVGITAAIGMAVLASAQGDERALTLSMVVFLAMVASCMISGIFGGLVPLTLRRIGADPATASGIFVTTVTDVASLALLLGLATIILL